MPTQIAQIVFNTIPDQFFPAAPAGWVKPSTDSTRILSGYFARGSTTPAIFRYNTPFSTNEIEAAVRLPPSLPVASLTLVGRGGGAFLDTTGNGYAMFCRVSGSNFIISVNLIVAYIYTTELFTTTITTAANLGKTAQFQRNTTTGVMKVFVDAVQLGSNFTDNIYSPTYGAALATESGSGVHTITLTDLASYSIVSFNGANDIERGQQNVVFDTNGFTTITSITTNQSGLTVGGTVVGDGDGHTDISDFVEGGLYPALPVSVIYTFSDGTNTAQITKTLAKKSTDTLVSLLGAITINDEFFPYHMLNAGRSVADGCQMTHQTTAGFTLNADGSFTADAEVTMPIWYRDVDNGRMYEFNATFTPNGSIVIEGLTAEGLTAVGVTARGLTAVGL